MEKPNLEAESGLRFDDKKPRFDLIPTYPMFQLARLFAFGTKKYAERNWEKGMPWSKVIAPLQRHLCNWMAGEDNDDETGLSHMIHVAWNAMVLVEYERLYRDLDDRTKNQFRFLDAEGNETKPIISSKIIAELKELHELLMESYL